MAAVEEAARREGLEVHRAALQVVDAGEETAVPPGCSWSNWSKRVLFNTNPRGAEVPLTGRRACGLPDGAPCYRLACTADRQARQDRQDRQAAGGERREREREHEQDEEHEAADERWRWEQASEEPASEGQMPVVPSERVPPKPAGASAGASAAASAGDCAPRIVQVHHKSGTQMVGAAAAAINYVLRHRLNGSCLPPIPPTPTLTLPLP